MQRLFPRTILHLTGLTAYQGIFWPERRASDSVKRPSWHVAPPLTPPAAVHVAPAAVNAAATCCCCHLLLNVAACTCC